MNVKAVLVRVAELAERLLGRVVILVVLVRGRRRPLVIPFLGHGTPERVRIGARIAMGHPDADTEPGDPGPPSRRRVLLESLSRFFTIEIPRARVLIRTPAGEQEVRADAEGYVDAVIDRPGLEPGWRKVDIGLADGTTSVAQVLVVDPRADVALVSDVDDTILETGVGRGLAFLRASLLTETKDRAPLPGSAALYRALVDTEVPRPVFYVSTSPWNLHSTLLEFIALRRFPLGPLLLTDWGPGHGNLFRIGAREHKTGLIRHILDEHPGLALVLVGDTGQLDPEIYAAVAEAAPDRVRAIYVRRTAAWDVRRDREVRALAQRITALGVPMLTVGDSTEIAVHAARIGLLQPAAVAAVRTETVGER
ncbi:Phosphatidate phosphatase APP1 [Pseudonocardia oroxyli]|uniref:Phosphatidate phosphatase APP1 n=1 Tax=Pseudonocardia oroxyli TaxID=366584 RepID=A0A1G7MP62_PSEOR|nr:Phosphatidate phosphatase APP1 [Pseudonocardia oroxyli]